ncbi:glutamate 5-kinase [Francisella philomiragia]|uniref:glutamate 5-kinase n=1 Tax=Francisella philomiragia TaxID=28110 RepID=UPI001C9E0065|nr:glutamate 5-kinase [Francisella philomiragia]MBY7734185.1 glutamate 5-kinase [Francisella philomiragia]
MQRKDLLNVVKRVVVKVGTSTLTHQTGLLNINRIEKLVRQLADLHNQGYEVILVTSGAVGAGMGKLGLQQKPKTLPEKQAIAAVGQVALTHLYQKLFSEYGKNIAQLLLTKDDIANRERYLNARNAFSALLAKGVIPIVNENDAVVIDEIKVGDNDTLSALVANLIDADLLILLSDIDGLYTANPRMDSSAKLLNIIPEISDDIRAMAGDVGSKFGTGGMATKIKAAEIAVAGGVNMIIANGEDPKILLEIVSGEDIGTLFAKNNKKEITAKKHWITYSSHKRGEIVIDQGAVLALKQKKSLLPCGVLSINGDFQKGATVIISNDKQEEIATGLVNYSSQDLEKIKGCKSSEIANILGYRDYNEVIHVDNMFLRSIR